MGNVRFKTLLSLCIATLAFTPLMYGFGFFDLFKLNNEEKSVEQSLIEIDLVDQARLNYQLSNCENEAYYYDEYSKAKTSLIDHIKSVKGIENAASRMSSDGCPNIQIVDLREVAGFPQADNLNVCGNPDTLSFLIFTDDPGVVDGFEMTLNMVQGMRYAGFEDTHNGGCTSISNSDPDINSPSFVANGVTCDDIFVANIGVGADCAVDIENGEYIVEIEYNYFYFPPSGTPIPCSGSFTIEDNFNNALKTPVLNMSNPSPIDAIVTSLQAPFCQNISISQDGLQAYLNEFEFSICGIDASPSSLISIPSITANGIDLTPGAVYNPADSSMTVTVGSDIFPTNGSENPFGESDQFDTDESVSIQVCYEVANCPSNSDIPFTYKAEYGCYDETCQTTGQGSILKVRPVGSESAIITATLSNSMQICGDDAEVVATIQNGNAEDTEQNVYTNFHIGFQACGIPAIAVTEVTVNGISVPPVWSLAGDDVDISFEDNLNAGIGLVDHDGDGFFDDLPGGSAPLEVIVKFNLSCSDPGAASGECVDINCENVQFYISGETNCGNTFKNFPDTGGFGLKYGAETVSNPDEMDLNTTGTVVGYNFGVFGNPQGAKTIEMTFCYDFNSENIESCPSGANIRYKLVVSGPDAYTDDLEYVPGTAMFSDDDINNFVAVDDSNVSMDYPTEGQAVMIIDFGLDPPPGLVCYKFQLEMEEPACAPASFLPASQQISSVCSDCETDCEILQACRSTLLRIDPNDTGCVCVASYETLSNERTNLGYKDKTMTEQWTKQELIDEGFAIDLGRFMPGDTLQHRGFLEIVNAELLNDPVFWDLSWSYYALSGTDTKMPALPLVIDAAASVLDTIRIENPDGSTHVVDISDLAGCASSGSSTYYESNFSTFGKQPWGTYNIEHPCNRNSGYNTYDFRDNQYLSWSLYNYEKIDDCGGTWANFAEGNCLDEFIDAYDITLNSKIYFTFRVPLVKNPHRETAELLGLEPPLETTARIYPSGGFYQYDPIAGAAARCNTANLGSMCRTVEPFNITCAGEVEARTDIELNNCGGTVEHTFWVKELPGTPGDPWFTSEYRPVVEMYDVSSPIYSPLAYCSNAQVTRNGVSVDLVVDSTTNMSCSPVAGFNDDLCAVDVGTEGEVIFNLFDQGISGLGVGLDNCDTIKLSYDYCMICPVPIEGLLDYKMELDYCNAGHIMDECSSLKYISTLVAVGHPARATYEARTYADDYPFATGLNYYDLLRYDTIYCKDNAEFPVVFVDDSEVTPTLPLTAANVDGKELIASESAGVSIELKEIEFCNPDPEDALGFSGYVTVPNAIAFMGACMNPDGTMPLTTALVSDDGQLKKYKVDFPSTTLGTGDCIQIFVKTTLLYCPEPGSLPPQVCVGASAGCSPEEVRAAIGGSGACASAEVCYVYLFGEADLQTEWFGMPDDPQLCETFTLNVRTKNVKNLLLLNLVPTFDLPFGMSVVPGSWEVAYPGGSVEMLGNFGPWTSVSDPDVVSGSSYSWSDDALWNTHIDLNGLVGVGSTLDSNKVSFRFQVTTNCDEFLSGSRPKTETLASDPCGPGNLSSGSVESPQIIIAGADPADHAQLLAVANPSELYCGGLTNTFGITALNISEYPTTDSVVTCVTIPTDVLTYTPGSIAFSTGFMPAWTTETVIGNTLQVCVHSPSIGVGETWSLSFEAIMNEDAPCGDIEIGADIKSVVESATCVPGPPEACDVFVQNSLNPSIFVELKPPLETTDLRVSTSCTESEDPIEVCYEIDLQNPGPMYDGDVTVSIFDDVTSNQVVDSYDTELNNAVHAVSLANGESTTIMMCLDVDAIQACPIIIRRTFETNCACDHEDTPIQSLEPNFIAELAELTVLCDDQELGLDLCGDYTLSYDPASNMVERITADSIFLSIVDPSIETMFTITGTIGECPYETTKSILGVTDFELALEGDEACQDQNLDLVLTIPDEYQDYVTVEWMPATYLDDANSAEPIFNSPDVGVYNYSIVLTFGDGCELMDEVSVEVLPIGDLGIGGDMTFCDGYAPGTLTTDAGFDYYEWYLLTAGLEVIQASTTTPEWNGPTSTGDYLVKGFRYTDDCPSISGAHTITAIPCVDIELEKSIVDMPYPAQLGDIVTYEIEVCNVLDPDLGLVHSQDNVVVEENLPAGLTYTGNSVTTGSFAPGTPGVWTVGTMAAGDCETLTLMASIDMFGTFTNVAEVTGGDTPDVDSEVDNDDGDQSEDDEDPEEVTIPYVDLALTKMLDPATVTPVTVGDDVNFIIEVCNQGTIIATNVEVTDYIPAGYILSTSDTNGWADNDNDGLHENTIAGPIDPEMCAQVEILLTVQAAMSTDDYINVAEISGSQDDMGNDTTDDDIDSTADEDEGNDPGGEVGGDTDDTTDGENGDEDDSDPATVPVEYTDLALMKTLAPGQPQTVMPGDFVDFEVTIFNQGSIDAYNVGIIDYIPSGLMYDDSFGNNSADGWSDSDADGNPEATLAGPIAAFTGSETIIITLQVDPDLAAPADLENVAEITGSEDVDGEPQEDIDSTPDDDDSNDGTVEDNATDGENGDEDDSDPAIINIEDEPIFDLALAKTLDPSTQTPVYPGDVITFNIEVINQGNVDAYNVELTDNMGACLEVDSPEPNGWVDSDNDGAYEFVIPGPVAAGTSTIVQMDVVVACASSDPDDYLNIAEISEAEDEDGNHPEDIDSTPDMDPDNDSMNPEDDNETEEDGSEGDDEDDHDWEFVPVETFDLALVKTLSATQDMPIMPGDEVVFDIEVINQGTVDAYNIDVTDYVPSGLEYMDSYGNNAADGWSDMDGDGNPTITINALTAGNAVTVQVSLIVLPGTQGSLTNWAEIGAAEDENGDMPEDVDSTPDDDPNNDEFGDDNQEDGDGSDDEDDHDPEEITIDYFDLALTKVLSDGQSQYVSPGDDVSFTIEVCNQGTITATDIMIAEYLPSGTVYSTNDTNGWTDVDMDGDYENTIAGPVEPGDCASIDFILTVLPSTPAPFELTNWAEIAGASDGDGNPADDVDSTADDDPDNDEYGDDNQEDGDGMDDEDDHDPAVFYTSDEEIFDLALDKEISPDQDVPVYPGTDITFVITIENQGNTDVTNVTVEDYLPAYLTLSSADTNGWVDADADGNPDQVIPSMMAGESIMLEIVVTLDAGFSGTSIENSAEITEFFDENGDQQEDTDSTPDDDPDNDEDDEDDEDTVELPVAMFDLALTKTLSPDEMAPYMPGDVVTFVVTVYNQGTVDAYNVGVVDYLPADLTLSPSDMNGWVDSDADGNPENTIAGPILAGQYAFVNIDLVINPALMTPADLTNFAEITMAEDENGNMPPDIDSDPDDDPDNDAEGDDNQQDGDGTDDEDDQDWETIPVITEVFDLALQKVINPDQEFPVGLGDDITFDIWVYNQGNIPATNIEVSEYMPSGTMMSTADMNGWTDFDNDGTYEQTILGPLAPGDSVLLMVVLTITDVSDPLGLVNESEISGADDENGDAIEDIDSTPDGDPDNDNGGDPYDDTNNEIDDDGTNDEDDHDPEVIPIFDLALTKTTSWTDPITYGDDIPFDINVINQGNISAYEVEVTEYIPCGYFYDQANNPLWTYDMATSTATTTIAGPIDPVMTTTVPIVLTVQPCPDGDPASNWTNSAEISGAQNEDGEDMSDDDPDSTPDNDPDNDPEGDNNQEDGDGTADEDDHDWETPPIFDLALTKELAAGQMTPVSLGDDVTFTITVYNQGTITATNVEVSDYVPEGYCLSPNDTNGWADPDMNGIYTATIAGPITPGMNATIDIVLEVKAAMSSDDYINVAEISGSMDDMGNDTTDDDIDSDADDNEHNDDGGEVGGDTDDTIDGEEGDEDDADPATVDVEFFDLAMVKMLAPGQPQQVMPGDDVTFLITVINQGTIDAYNVAIAEYLPADMTLSSADTNGWTDVDADGILENSIAGPIAGYGGTDMIEIVVTINPSLSTPAELTNWSEISGAEDENGEPQDDVDSTPDDDPNNDPYGDDNQEDGDGTDDEDDSDPAVVEVSDEEIFDLALVKTLDPATETPVYVGSEITFYVEVFNQGNITAMNIELTDNMGASLALSSNDTNSWVDSDNDGAYENLIVGPLAPGQSEIIPMVVTVVAAPMGPNDLLNIAEISTAEDEEGNHPEDIDSTPDMDPSNDSMNPDDNNESEEDGSAGGDEDDHDWEEVPFGSFDLALVKTLSPDQPMPIMPCDDVTFVFTVINQGTVDAYNIDIVEYTPAGMELSSSDFNGWTDTDMDGNYENTIAGLNAGESFDLEIVLKILPGATGPLTNFGEIADAEDEYGNHPEDVDSTPDDDPDNDNEGDDNQEDGDGSDDEDDHDWEEIDLGWYDLALTKQLAPGQSAYVSAGDDVTFVIEVVNQGTLDAYNIAIAEYVPAGMSLSSADTNGWTDVDMDGTLENVIPGPLMPNDRGEVEIVLTIDASFTGSSIENHAEISEFTDADGDPQEDNDSTPDDDPNNDPFGDDNQEDGNGMDDEDDSDPEVVYLSDGDVYDMALSKNLDPDTEFPVFPGDDVTFIIEVTNQGNTVVQNVDVVDYLPADLTLSSADTNGWVDTDADGYPENTIPGPMNPGDVVELEIVVTISEDFTGTSLENRAEIAEFEDEDGMVQEDEDSTSDNDPDNDPEGEDDEDGDEFPVSIFDLALDKTLAPGVMGPFMPGDDVTFRIAVHNQGTVDAYNVNIAEYIPADLALSTADMNGWTDADMNGVYENQIAGPITPGNYDFIDIILTIDPGVASPSQLVNVSEISGAEDENGNMPMDTDSTPDDDPDDDAQGDNDQLDGNGDNDEDDHDWEPIDIFDEIFDLALKKVLTPGFLMGGVQVGEDVSFDIWVYNQGTVDATNIEISEYMPDNTSISVNDMNGWTDFDNDGTYEQTLAGPLAPGDSVMVSFILTLDSYDGNNEIVNYAEISGADDGNGEPATDIDSTPDGDDGNDEGGNHDDDTNNEIDDDGTTDEDDHDPEAFPVFDLALIKTSESLGPHFIGDTVQYDFTVYNQGNITATNVMISDYMPCGFSFDSSLNPDWTEVSSTMQSTVVPGPIEPNDFAVASIYFVVQFCDTPQTAWINTGEITQSFDDTGYETTDEDIDSNADQDGTNDGEMTDNDLAGSMMDEDDSDLEFIAVPAIDLVKTVTDVQPSATTAGHVDVTFEIYIKNIGNEDLENIEIQDELDDPANLGPAYIGIAPGGDPVYVGTNTAVTPPTINATFDAFSTGDPDLFDAAAPSLLEVCNEFTIEFTAQLDPALAIDPEMLFNTATTNGEFELMDGTEGEVEDEDVVQVIPCVSNCEVACQGSINVSLNEDCEAEITPAMAGAGIEDYCNSYYEIELFDPWSNPLPTDVVGMDLVDECITYMITEPECGNTCWGTACIEYKLPPSIVCPYDVTVACNGLETVDESLVITEFCAPSELVLINEVIDNLECDEDFIREVTRTYVVRDDKGNESEECTFSIFLERVNLDSIFCPESFMTITDNPLACNHDIPLDANGHPVPYDEATGLGTGVPAVIVPAVLQFDDSGMMIGNSNSSDGMMCDLDGDGDDDMIVLNDGQPNKVFFNDGTGNFTDSGQNLGTSLTFGFDVEDIDGDGDKDVVIANDLGPNMVYTNDGTGIFTDSGQALGTSASYNLSLCDLDADGDIDAFFANSFGPNEVFLNDGTGLFTDSGQALGLNDSFGVSLEDIDGDGDKDAVVSNGNTGTTVYLNNGAGLFTDSGQNLGLPGSRNTGICDLDGDGDLDIFKAGLNVPNMVFLNDGTGTFSDSGQLLDAFETHDAKFVDVDCDGDKDVITAEFGPNQIYLNDGAAVFTNAGINIGGDDSSTIELNDVDGDGDLDIVEFNAGTPNKVFTNNSVCEMELGLYPEVALELCNVFVTYEDIEIPGVACSEKIMRTWSIREWWCGGELDTLCFQVIETVDEEGPAITCPDDLTVTTNTADCEAIVDLAAIEATDECNEIEKYLVHYGTGVLLTNGGEASLSVGTHTVSYEVFDNCYNSSECEMTVTVRDQIEPTPVCQQNIVVSLNNFGEGVAYVESMDDGTFDDCHLDSIRVSRMVDNCDNPLNLTFREKVEFCCADANMEHMVVFRAWDSSQNFNDCMVSVTVQDKIAPSMVCLDDVTINCTEVVDLDNLDINFGLPAITDNCTNPGDLVPTIEDDRNSCGIGSITRRLDLVDNGQVVQTCVQNIEVINNNPFDLSDIIWPADYEGSDFCDVDQLSPDNLPVINGYPQFTDGPCELIGYEFVDQVFEFVEGEDACLKILRNWTIIDWCQQVDGEYLRFPHEQVIKLFNTVDPVITSECTGIVVETSDINCESADVALVAEATDDCTSEDGLRWEYVIDAGSDGTDDIFGDNNDASGTYPVGLHTITWTVYDGCGNLDQCSYTFEIKSVKAPQPICIYGLSIALIPMDLDSDGTSDAEMVTIWASDVDGGSFHPCDYDIVLSFSEDVNDNNLTFDCDDIGQNPIELFVTDETGNQSYCETYIIVQDNNDEEICPPVERVDITGSIETKEGLELEDIEVYLEGGGVMEMTNGSGDYTFADMPIGGAYQVKPKYDLDPLNGVSTLDIVIIQRHILGIKDLDDAYELIAADANNDESITSSDLLDIRRMILGLISSFPNNESWRFVDKNQQFIDEMNPWNQGIDETYNIGFLEYNMLADFIGVKTADVNGSVQLLGEDADTRGNNTTVFIYEVVGNELRIYAKEAMELSGMQLAFNVDASELVSFESDLDLLSDENIAFDKQTLKLSYAPTSVINVAANTLLFKATFDELNNKVAVSNSFDSETYVGEELSIHDIIIEGKESSLLVRNYPNPWAQSTTIEFECLTEETVEISFYNTVGQLEVSVQVNAIPGYNRVVFDKEMFSIGGMKNYQILRGDGSINYGKTYLVE